MPGGGSPLRQSASPPPDRMGPNVYETSFVAPPIHPADRAAINRMSHDLERSRSRSGSIIRKRGYTSPIKMPIHENVRRNPDINPHATALRVEDLMQEIENLKADRDFYIREVDMERAKNRELEEEFAVLRGLIAETRPIGVEENIALKN